MVKAAHKLRQGITKYQNEYYDMFDAGDIILPLDWASLQHILDFLQPFERVTKEVEGDTATLDMVLYTMDFLVKHYEKMEVRRPLPDVYICVTIACSHNKGKTCVKCDLAHSHPYKLVRV